MTGVRLGADLSRLDRIEVKREALLSAAEALDPDELRRRPAEDGWSALEIVEHLVLAEEGVMGDLSDPAALEAERQSLKDRLLYPVVMFILRYGIPVKVPSRRMVPRGEVSLEELTRRWRANHRALRDFLAHERASSAECFFRHPVSGPMTTGAALRMLETHLDRHVGQFHRLPWVTEESELTEDF